MANKKPDKVGDFVFWLLGAIVEIRIFMDLSPRLSELSGNDFLVNLIIVVADIVGIIAIPIGIYKFLKSFLH